MRIFITIFVCILLVSPVIVILHEMGHAIPALIITKKTIEIQYGRGFLNKRLKVGKLNFNFKGYNSFWDLMFGCIKVEGSTNKLQNIIICVGGPIVSLIMFYTSAYILRVFLFDISYYIKFILIYIKWAALSQFIFTIAPINYKFYPSDGYRLVKLFRF